MDPSFQEIRDILKRNALHLEKLALLQAENEKGFKELRDNLAVSQARTDQQIQALKESQARTDQQIQDTNKEVGGIGNVMGNSLEYSFFTSLREHLFLDGIKYDKIYTKLKTKQNEKEFDIVLENGKTIALIEVKNTPREKHFKALKNIKKDYIKNFQEDKDKEIRVYLASENFNPSILDLAVENKIKLLTLKNDIVQVFKADRKNTEKQEI